MRKITVTILFIVALLSASYGQNITLENSQWKNKKVAFLGDSMTQKRDSSVTVYWEYLTEILGIDPLVYGISGHQWTNIYNQALKLKEEHGTNLDAILIFAGTNDYNHNTPMGNFYRETAQKTNYNGTIVTRKYRVLPENDITFCGRINKTMAFLKANFPDQQIIIMTPIHRGFAKFNTQNVQPEENFSNDLGYYIEDYVNTLKEATSVWAVPLIDLYSVSGLYPVEDSYIKFFCNPETDRLHSNSLGNYRLAKTIQYQLMSLPSGFVSH